MTIQLAYSFHLGSDKNKKNTLMYQKTYTKKVLLKMIRLMS